MPDIQIEEETKKFAACIQQTDTYQEYRRQRERLKKQPELYE